MIPDVYIYDRRDKSGNLLLSVFRHLEFHARLVKEEDELFRERFRVLVTEINDDPLFARLKVQNPGLKILLFSNFSRDPYIEKLYESGIEMALTKSYKLNDIVGMTKNAAISAGDSETLLGLKKYFIRELAGAEKNGQEALCAYSKKGYFGDQKSVTSAMFDDFNQFYSTSDLQELIPDPDMLHIAVSELIDNAVRAQLLSGRDSLDISMEIGCDSEKIGISIHNDGKPPDKVSLFSSLNRKMKLSNSDSSLVSQENTDKYVNDHYLGESGRGFYIIQKGVHLLSIVLVEDQKKEENPNLFEASILLYLSRHRKEVQEGNGKTQGNYMVLTL